MEAEERLSLFNIIIGLQSLENVSSGTWTMCDFAVNIQHLRLSRAKKCDGDHLADSGDSDGVYRRADGGGYVG